MKKWTGGTVILALATILILRYTLLSTTTAAPRRRPTLRRPSPPPPAPKSHLLPSLPGLDGLFPTNHSRPFSSPQLIWAHMRSLLLRSDALPATADGVREASAAWRGLLGVLEEEEQEKKASLSVVAKKLSCPFSVVGNGSSVKIPCGMVQDSAISLVAIPNGSNTSSRFSVKLIGSRLGDEPADSPIVLMCNFSLSGDDQIEVPVLSQNAWMAEKGWGEWERCPAADSNPKDSTVDDLVRCNEQLGESVVSENVNRSQLDGRKSPEESKRRPHLSANFLLIEGHPFTATLWAGVEGFHITINGRHEASFTYRENLEPWSVTEVRVDGDLDLLSFLVNGLPVNEDVDLAGVEILKAPPAPKRRLFLLVGIFSAANNFNRRMALRRSWMQYEAVRSGIVAVRFLTGLHKSMKVNLELWREAQMYGDIQLMPFVDYYSLITLKTIGVCILGTKILPAKYIMKTDDDAFVRIDEVLSILKRSDSHGLLYGLISSESSPHRDGDSKWYISPKEWPHDTYPPWAHGPGYIISRDIAKFIVHGHQERYLQMFKLEDVAMGIWIEEFKKGGEEVHYVNDDRFHNVGCQTDYVLAHYQGPRLLLCLWEKLQKEHEPICCE